MIPTTGLPFFRRTASPPDASCGRRRGRRRWGGRRRRWGGGQHLRRCLIEIRARSALVCRTGLVLGTPLGFPTTTDRVAPVTAPILAPVAAPAPPHESADHRSAHATTDCPAPTLSRGVGGQHQRTRAAIPRIWNLVIVLSPVSRVPRGMSSLVRHQAHKKAVLRSDPDRQALTFLAAWSHRVTRRRSSILEALDPTLDAALDLLHRLGPQHRGQGLEHFASKSTPSGLRAS